MATLPPDRDGDDYCDDALALTRDEFAARHPHPFLFCIQTRAAPQRSVGTEILNDPTGPVRLGETDRLSGRARPWVLAVKKVQPGFPSMITIGRTRNNDLVIEDAWVSKFHAYFRPLDRELELVDGGSRNTTSVNGRKLEPRAAGAVLKSGDRVRFGQLEFVFLDSASCWSQLVRALDQWG